MGSEVFLRIDIISEEYSDTIDLFRAPAYTWCARYLWPIDGFELERGEYEGRIGLSPPAAYPSTMGNEANEGSI